MTFALTLKQHLDLSGNNNKLRTNYQLKLSEPQYFLICKRGNNLFSLDYSGNIVKFDREKAKQKLLFCMAVKLWIKNKIKFKLWARVS